MTAALAAPLAREVVGQGAPVTLLVHGLGGARTEVRPLALGLPGTRVLVDLRGHGDSPPLARGWDYGGYAEDLRTVADQTGATRAVGLSLGVGVLLRLLGDEPDRFDALALVLPATLDGGVRVLDGLADAVDAGDPEPVLEHLLAQVPAALRTRPHVRRVLARKAELLVRQPAPRPAVRAEAPLADRALLAAVRAPALVVGQPGDPVHPLAVAEQLAAALPAARLLVLPEGGFPWTAARALRTALASHWESV